MLSDTSGLSIREFGHFSAFYRENNSALILFRQHVICIRLSIFSLLTPLVDFILFIDSLIILIGNCFLHHVFVI